MYKIKQIPEDFAVKEKLRLNFDTNGEYAYFLLKKKDLTTHESIQLISKEFKIPLKSINCAGNKDKNAVTEQYISIKGKRLQQDFSLKNLELKYLGNGKERIYLGMLDENEFEIVIRNLSEENIKALHNNIGLLKKMDYYLPNYFDEQRFSKKNFEIGVLLTKKDYSKATEMLRNDPQFFQIEKHLTKNPNDYIGALNRVNKRVLRLYVHAVQSYIFNETLSKHYIALKNFILINYSMGMLAFPLNKIRNRRIQMVGFDTDFQNNDLDKVIKEIMRQLNLDRNDFLNRQIPELTLETAIRNSLVKIINLSTISLSDDELNKNKKKAKMRFTLPKGSYATMVVKFLLN